MKNIISIIVFVFVSQLVLAQTQTENYVRSTTYQVKTTDGEHKAGTTTDLIADDKLESITYYDGLGRPKQSITLQAGGSHQDIITPIKYDALLWSARIANILMSFIFMFSFAFFSG